VCDEQDMHGPRVAGRCDRSVEPDVSADADKLDQLIEDLRLSRAELAQVRQGQEPLLEELALVRHQLETTRRRFEALSQHVDDRLQALPVGDSLPVRARRWAVRRLRARRREWRDAERLRASPLFNGRWYVRRHPEVVASGLSPAVHYLRHGAAAGFDPSPDFKTSRYLAEHPDAARSGANPLLHHLDASANGGQ
jgi:hypothetical protein